MTQEQLSEYLESLPAPDGFDWLVTNYEAYGKACRDGLPTFFAEFSCDGDTAMVYLVGQHELVGVVQP